MENKLYETWKEIKEELELTPEQQAEIKLEEEIIEATIEARKKNKISQRELSKISGIKQPVIARIEKGKNSPTTSTLIKMLLPLGYTIGVVPINKSKNEKDL